MIGFGIDLAGYPTGKTSLAAVKIEGRIVKATLLRDSALSVKRQSSDALAEILPQEVEVLRRCLKMGSVAVDIPIDLQGLPNPKRAVYLWELTRRPIEKAVNAMPPFADRIGSPVARFAAIMQEDKFGPLLGERLFEAYPAGTLKMLKIAAGRYKGKDGAEALISLCKTLKIEPPVSSDHDIDAIISAITAASPAYAMFNTDDFQVRELLPKGFRIPNNLSFDRIEMIDDTSFDAWMTACEAAA